MKINLEILIVLFQIKDGGEYKMSEDVKIGSYINVLCKGEGEVYYAGGKEGFLVKLAQE